MATWSPNDSLSVCFQGLFFCRSTFDGHADQKSTLLSENWSWEAEFSSCQCLSPAPISKSSTKTGRMFKNYARCQPRFSQVLTTCCFPASSAEGPPPSCTSPHHPPTPLHSSPKAIRHGPLPTRDLLVLLTPVRLGLTPVTLGITLQCLPVVICQHRRTLTGRHGRTSRYGILSTKQTFC